MQHHFVDVVRVQEAVIRGDLSAVRAAAGDLIRMPPPADTKPDTAKYVIGIREAGRRAGQATALPAAALAAATMLSQCGECHRSLNVMPAVAARQTPDVGGIVGHMLAHQNAADRMLQGLIVPSNSYWQMGAEALRAAPLKREDLPPDPKLTKEVRAAETAVHEASDLALEATTTQERVATYGALLATCAQCHALHSRAWGPDRR
jgi:hypothetical protein